MAIKSIHCTHTSDGDCTFVSTFEEYILNLLGTYKYRPPLKLDSPGVAQSLCNPWTAFYCIYFSCTRLHNVPSINISEV